MTLVAKLITANLSAVGLMAVLAAPAAAQDPSTAGAPPGRPRPIELSIGGAGVLSWLSSGGDIRAMVQKTLSPRLALRIEVQGLVALVIPAGVRVGISLTMPLGPVYETGPRAR